MLILYFEQEPIFFKSASKFLWRVWIFQLIFFKTKSDNILVGGIIYSSRFFLPLFIALSLSLSLFAQTHIHSLSDLHLGTLSFVPRTHSNTLHTQARTHTHTLSFSFSFLSHLNLSILWAPDSVYGARWSRYVSNGYAYQSSLNVS